MVRLVFADVDHDRKGGDTVWYVAEREWLGE